MCVLISGVRLFSRRFLWLGRHTPNVESSLIRFLRKFAQKMRSFNFCHYQCVVNFQVNHILMPKVLLFQSTKGIMLLSHELATRLAFLMSFACTFKVSFEL